MNTYLFLLRSGSIDFGTYSPEDMQKLLSDFDAWNARMIQQGALLLSGNLGGKGSRVLMGNGVVKDGPYGEGKEGLTGFFIVQAAGEDEAQQYASGCPFLTRGGVVELRLIPALEFEEIAGTRVANDQTKRTAAGAK